MFVMMYCAFVYKGLLGTSLLEQSGESIGVHVSYANYLST